MDAAGVRQVRRRPEEQPVHDAEHGRVGADAEAQRQHHREREARPQPEPAQRVAQILPDGPPPVRAPLGRDTPPVHRHQARAGPAHVAAAALRLTARFARLHATLHELLHSQLEVQAQLVLHLALHVGRATEPEHAPQAGPAADVRAHAVWRTLNMAVA